MGIPALILSTACLAMAGLPGDWQVRQTPVTTHLTALAPAPGQIIAVGHGPTILSSGNGIDWQPVPYAGSGDFHSIAFAKGLYVAGGSLDCMLAISPDGLNWTNIQSTGGSHAYFGATCGGGRFVVVGRGGLLVPTRINSSTNGIDWQPADVPPTTNPLRAVTFGNGKYVAVGDHGTILTSTDAITWTLQISGTEHLLRSVMFTGREFLAGGDSSTLLTSGDGISWVSVPFSSFDVRSLATSGTAVVGVGGLAAEGRLQASTNGLSWSGAVEAVPSRLNSVIHYALGKFFAVGNDGLIVESGAVANAPVNVWTKTTDGYWHEGPWSLGHMPSWSDTAIAFTNGGTKTLEINSITSRDHPDSLRIRELRLYGTPEDAQNTLFLNNAGWDVPLKIDAGLLVPPGFSFVSVNSAFEGSGMNLSSRATFSDAHTWFRGPVTLGVMAPAEVVLSNGYFTAMTITVGQNVPATWTQYGGTNETEFLRLQPGSTYALAAGWLLCPTLAIAGTFTQTGGTNVASIFGAAHYELSSGRLVSSAATIHAALPGEPAGFTQTGGEHIVRGGLNILGVYALHAGALSAPNIFVEGQLELTGGVVSNDRFHLGGILKASGTHRLGQLLGSRRALIDFQDTATVVYFHHALDWVDESPMIVTNWTSGSDQLFIGHNQAELTAAQLSRIRFANPGGFSPGLYSARITSTGEVVPVPRLVSYQRNANGLVLTWPEGYRLLTATNVAGPYSLITNAISPYTTASYHTDPQRFFIIRNEN